MLGVIEFTETVCGDTVTEVVAVAPAKLVTVRVNVLEAVIAELLKATPLVTVPTPWFTEPVPLLKVGVILVLLP